MIRLCLLALLLGGCALGQILSLEGPEDPLIHFLDPQATQIRLRASQPWSFAQATCGNLAATYQGAKTSWNADLGWQDWQGLQAQSADLVMRGPALAGLAPGLRLRMEFLEGRRFHLLDFILAMEGPIKVGLRFRLDEQAESGISARSSSEAMALSISTQNMNAAWLRGLSAQGRVDDLLRLKWQGDTWNAAWTWGPAPGQELSLGWKGKKRFARLHLRWHPWLGVGRSLVLGSYL